MKYLLHLCRQNILCTNIQAFATVILASLTDLTGLVIQISKRLRVLQLLGIFLSMYSALGMDMPLQSTVWNTAFKVLTVQIMSLCSFSSQAFTCTCMHVCVQAGKQASAVSPKSIFYLRQQELVHLPSKAFNNPFYGAMTFLAIRNTQKCRLSSSKSTANGGGPWEEGE